MLVDGIKTQDNTSFGWRHSTHKLATYMSVEKYNKLLPKSEAFNYEILKYSCIQPDLERKNITKYIHGHFADIDNLSKDPPDAYALCSLYTTKAIKAHEIGLYSKRDDYVGYALHFLQDMLNPMHVEFKPLKKEHPERIFHRFIEEIAEQRQDAVFTKSASLDVVSSDHFFADTLPKAMRKNKNLFKSLKQTDSVSVTSVIDKALENTYITTDIYFKKLVNEFNKTSQPLSKPVSSPIQGTLVFA